MNMHLRGKSNAPDQFQPEQNDQLFPELFTC